MKLLMENWRKYLKDHDLDELPLGATTGPLAEPGREVYKFESPEERWEYTKWKYPKAKRHKMDFTWDDIFGDDDPEDEGLTITVAMTPEKQQKEFDRLVDEEDADPKDLKATGKYPDVDSLSSEVAERYFKRKYDWLEETKIKDETPT